MLSCINSITRMFWPEGRHGYTRVPCHAFLAWSIAHDGVLCTFSNRSAPDRGMCFGSPGQAEWTVHHVQNRTLLHGSLSSSQPGRPPIWSSPLTIGLIGSDERLLFSPFCSGSAWHGTDRCMMASLTRYRQGGTNVPTLNVQCTRTVQSLLISPPLSLFSLIKSAGGWNRRFSRAETSWWMWGGGEGPNTHPGKWV